MKSFLLFLEGRAKEKEKNEKITNENNRDSVAAVEHCFLFVYFFGKLRLMGKIKTFR